MKKFDFYLSFGYTESPCKINKDFNTKQIKRYLNRYDS